MAGAAGEYAVPARRTWGMVGCARGHLCSGVQRTPRVRAAVPPLSGNLRVLRHRTGEHPPLHSIAAASRLQSCARSPRQRSFAE